jgi:hypothetical protein
MHTAVFIIIACVARRVQQLLHNAPFLAQIARALAELLLESVLDLIIDILVLLYLVVLILMKNQCLT